MPVETKPAALLDRTRTLFMGFCTHTDLPLEINGKEAGGQFPVLGVDE